MSTKRPEKLLGENFQEEDIPNIDRSSGSHIVEDRTIVKVALIIITFMILIFIGIEYINYIDDTNQNIRVR
jgi:hypothetical protein